MALVATNKHDPSTLSALLTEIEQRVLAEPGLTPRSRRALQKVANSGDLILLWSEGNLAGWGVRERLAPSVKEVGLMFVKPEFRGAVAFAELARELTNDRATLIMASYDPALIRYVVAKCAFQRASLGDVALRSWGRFITKRLSKTARTAVRQHTSLAKPQFAIRGKR
ncbi:MAG: hypothetical protein RL196_1147 [Actinomycetota bacterium]